MYRRFIPVLALVAAALMTIRCGGVSSPSQNRTETFSGTLALGGFNAHSFNVQNTGEFSVKITALAPTATAIVGTRWGQGGNCEFPIQQSNFSVLNQTALVGAVFQKGTYCVAVFDSGGLSVAQNYTVTVSHP
jgi:hypothetical protein